MSGAPAGGAPDEEETTGAFRRSRGRVSARFTAAQAVILRNLVSQVAELMGTAADPGAADPAAAGTRGGPGPGRAGRAGLYIEELAAAIGATGPTSPPEDPVLARLLPDAYRDDPEAAGEFRRYTEQGLRSGKVAAAQTVLATLPAGGGHVRLGPEDAAGVAARAQRRPARHRDACWASPRTTRMRWRRPARPTRVPPISRSITGSATSRRPWCARCGDGAAGLRSHPC